jgi:hypothetical protein
MPSAVTNDSEQRAILTVNVTTSVGVANWSASVLDNNPNFSGFGSSGASWTITIGGITVATASNQSYDFGTNNIVNPFFPRSQTGSVNLAPGTYTATGTFTTTGVVGTASLSFSFTVPAPTTPVWSTGTSLAAAVRNRSVSRTVVASPATSYALVSSSGATGLSVSSGGVISGTPTVFGTASLTIRASNTVNGYTATADRTFTMVILSTPPKVWTTSFVDGLLQVWNGSSWVRGRIRVWNGTAWVDNA